LADGATRINAASQRAEQLDLSFAKDEDMAFPQPVIDANGNVEQNDSRKIYPPRRQDAKLRIFSDSSDLGAFAGDMVFPIFSSFPNFKDFCLEFPGKPLTSSALGPSIVAYQDKLSDSGQFSRNNSALTQQSRNLPLL
jgi:hypothetical protein